MQYRRLGAREEQAVFALPTVPPSQVGHGERLTSLHKYASLSVVGNVLFCRMWCSFPGSSSVHRPPEPLLWMHD